MRYFVLSLILLGSCKSTIGDTSKGTADARPITFTTPPEPKGGSQSAPGCEGITVSGKCKDGKAWYCDLQRGKAKKRDCAAMGRECVVDVGRGAICKNLDGDSGGPKSTCTDTNVSAKGYCSQDGNAIYCDKVTKPDEPYTRSWKCSDFSMTCKPDGCGNEGDTAFCCADDTTPATTDCGTIGYAGVCDDATNTAKWCSSSDPETGQLMTKDCGGSGQTCKVDDCLSGEAWCCGSSTSECSTIGSAGVCSADKTKVRYCLLVDVLEETCLGTDTCQVDACGAGARCCPPPGSVDPECAALGYAGECTADGKLRYCLGTKDTDIISYPCEAGASCAVDVCGTGAYCCDSSPECTPAFPVGGRCLDDKVQTCNAQNQLVEDPCYLEGKVCVDDPTNFSCGTFSPQCCPKPCSPSGFPGCSVGTCTDNGFGEYFCM